jgi:hypothetical protein
MYPIFQRGYRYQKYKGRKDRRIEEWKDIRKGGKYREICCL